MKIDGGVWVERAGVYQGEEGDGSVGDKPSVGRLPSRAGPWAALFVAAASLTLSACGGGGDAAAEGATAIADAPPPVASSPSASPSPSPTTPPAAAPSTNPAPSPAPTPTSPPPSSAAPTLYVIEGTASYEHVPRDPVGGRLLYGAVSTKPVRGAVVRLLNETSDVLAESTTDDLGRYRFDMASASVRSTKPSALMRVRVHAESRPALHHFAVRDNTREGALYAMDSRSFAITGGSATVNLLATTGWGGSSYTGDRTAAPFAILDVAYAAQAKVAALAPTTPFAPLNFYWSPNNRPVMGDAALGEIGSSHFNLDASWRPQIHLLGTADADTDEFDASVIAHELGHYVQHVVSRNDSPGGMHSIDDKIDMRGAFSEGFGNAWASMMLGDAVYADSLGVGQASGFSFSVAALPRPASQGWFNEGTVQYLLWHAMVDVGLEPIYQSLVAMKNVPAFTSIFSYQTLLRQARPHASQLAVRAHGVGVTGAGIYGEGETNHGDSPWAVPIYAMHLAAPGVPQTHCVSSALGLVNHLGNHAFIRFATSSAGERTVTATRISPTDDSASNPSMMLIGSDQTLGWSASMPQRSARLVARLPAGTHALSLTDHALPGAPRTHCFAVTVN